MQSPHIERIEIQVTLTLSFQLEGSMVLYILMRSSPDRFFSGQGLVSQDYMVGEGKVRSISLTSVGKLRINLWNIILHW